MTTTLPFESEPIFTALAVEMFNPAEAAARYETPTFDEMWEKVEADQAQAARIAANLEEAKARHPSATRGPRKTAAARKSTQGKGDTK